MSLPTDDTPAPSPPIRIPPSVGGSGLSIVAGLILGQNVVEGLVLGADVPLSAWLAPLGLLGFIVGLIKLGLVARDRMGVRVDPSSIRRQWIVVTIALLVGLGMGAAIPFVTVGPG